LPKEYFIVEEDLQPLRSVVIANLSSNHSGFGKNVEKGINGKIIIVG